MHPQIPQTGSNTRNQLQQYHAQLQETLILLNNAFTQSVNDNRVLKRILISLYINMVHLHEEAYDGLEDTTNTFFKITFKWMISNLLMQQLLKGQLQTASGFPRRQQKREEHEQREICDFSAAQIAENDNTHNCTQNGLCHQILSHQSPSFSRTVRLPQQSKKSSTNQRMES